MQSNHHPHRIGAVIDRLFGTRLNEISASIHTLERQMVERLNSAENEMRVRIGAHDQMTREKIESLNQASRDVQSSDTIDGQLRIEVRELEQRLEAIAGGFSGSHEVAREKLRIRLAEVTGETARLRQGMEQEITDSRAALASRTELGGLFAELAKRLGADVS